ncbi:MAG: glucose-6-phosphate dehydrogenase [Planctomycetes bacterium]|nr:glucose-6-phosphate dehydrogenase [Planctomycetota bacterium]
MPVIEPSVTKQEIICAETPGEPCGLVVFGASGDLTRRKLLDSLFQLYLRDLLAEQFYFVGCGRKPLSDDDYRDIARQSISAGNAADEQVAGFLERIHFVSGNYDDPAFYEAIKSRLDELDEKFGVDQCHIFYLAVPPTLYGTITDGLGRAGLARPSTTGKCPQARLIVEKPFGTDLETAIALNDRITRSFNESQIYRIDHYLGKETVQNILMFRFANAIFEPVWNLQYIDHVQITIAESLGIEHRSGYYDKSVAMRDMFQNHMMQLLALTAMEPPSLFEADRVRDEKVKVFRSLKPLPDRDQEESLILGQYGSGTIDGERVPAYRDESDVNSTSLASTFAIMRVFIDNWRWRGVPFYMVSGKRLPKKLTEIVIQFREVPHSMFRTILGEHIMANQLILGVQPDERITLTFQTKNPGARFCLRSVTMDFNYYQNYSGPILDAYEKVLLDCIQGDHLLFWRQDGVELCWSFLSPILEQCETCPERAEQLHLYESGTWGPQATQAWMRLIIGNR